MHLHCTVKKFRGGIGEFQAPFGVAYNGVFYATKEEADAEWGTHGAKKRLELKGGESQSQTQSQTHTQTKSPTGGQAEKLKSSAGDEEGDEENDESLFATQKDPSLFKLGVLCIPTKPGWSRAIIMSGGQAKETKAMAKYSKTKAAARAQEASVAVVDVKSDTNDTKALKSKAGVETSNQKQTKEKQKKKSLIAIIFGIIPPWVIHLLSNKFLDSDLAFLHYQEQERLRYEATGGNRNSSISSYYFMPTEADRCIAKLRKWIPMHTDYLGGDGLTSSHTYVLPPPILDRTKLFDRYLQHTSHCKHCQDGLKGLQNTVRRTAWGGVLASVVASHFLRSRTLGLLAKLAAIACLASLRLVSSLEQAFKVGEFKHYQND